jgi:hypothetical protein
MQASLSIKPYLPFLKCGWMEGKQGLVRIPLWPVLEYASPVWAGPPDYLQQEIERVQTSSLRIFYLNRDCLPSLRSRRKLATIREIRRIQAKPNHLAIPYFLILENTHMHELRQNNSYTVLSRTEIPKQSFIARSINIYKSELNFVLLTFKLVF